MAAPAYLRPYLDAVGRHGAKFESLLWANPSAQAARFGALARHCDLQNRVLLDAGCGRADFLQYLYAQGITPQKYIGIEAVDELAAAAEHKHLKNTLIQRADFITDPKIMDQNADTILFSGSLNTLSMQDFYQSIRLAWDYTQRELAFNFLCSPRLASARHLTWYPIGDILSLAYSFTNDVSTDNTYRDGDCTMVLRK
jgi:hypothetical protein